MPIRSFGVLATLLVFAGALTAFTPDPPAQSVPYAVDKAHSQVQFKVKHLGITTVTGSFRDFEIDLDLDPEDLSSLQTSATIQTATIDTGIERRDGHLRSGDFFEAETYPTLTFVSTGTRNVSGNQFELLGDLTIRDVTKPVVLTVEMAGPVTDMEGKPRVAFTASTRIDRKDYGLQWNRVVEGVNVVSDDVDIVLDLQAAPADV
jgi:polyisoprenoid-binding protein YceI